MLYQFQQAEIKLNCLKASVCLSFRNPLSDNCNSPHLFQLFKIIYVRGEGGVLPPVFIWYSPRFSNTSDHRTFYKSSKVHHLQNCNFWQLTFADYPADYLSIKFLREEHLQEKKKPTCGMMDMFWRRVCRPSSEVRNPSIIILPSGSASRNKAEIRVLLPAPVRPTMPTYEREEKLFDLPWNSNKVAKMVKYYHPSDDVSHRCDL